MDQADFLERLVPSGTPLWKQAFTVWLDRFRLAILAEGAKTARDVDHAASRAVLPNTKRTFAGSSCGLSWGRNAVGMLLDYQWKRKLTVEGRPRVQADRIPLHGQTARAGGPIGHQWEVAVPAEERDTVETDEPHVTEWGTTTWQWGTRL
ncbi:hypothetical protein Hypma_014281 [Hypsizygus marmoreus]|uniref:Uncharacterized protein n=1 Tax=Hypsizygus marmoreus TaxID=39966 RepID=A0A369JI02_HYPMA|nr:hypothetical protein Hypma_014281 [Hypsizygus marmoreus]